MTAKTKSPTAALAYPPRLPVITSPAAQTIATYPATIFPSIRQRLQKVRLSAMSIEISRKPARWFGQP